MEDTAYLVPETKIYVLDAGFVQLIDWSPRMAPPGRTPEYAIVQCARVSTGAGIKSLKEDNALINRLWRCKHTSPFERVKFTFLIRAPKMVRTHFIRHRTANVNEFSQRYAEVPETFYRPSRTSELWSHNGQIRTQSNVDKQASVMESSSNVKQDLIRHKFQEAEALIEACFAKYRQLMELGVPRELARFCLPDAVYTDFYFTMDLNNLLKFLSLRNDPAHAQSETVLYAKAMQDLITPLIPQTMKSFQNWNYGAITLSEEEVDAIAHLREQELLDKQSPALREEFRKKLDRLGIISNN
jgi:thymidylate synthase (FAD)